MDNTYILTAFTGENQTTILDRLGISGIASIIGMGLVFLVLALLIVCIILLNNLLNKFEKNKGSQIDTTVNVKNTSPTPTIIVNDVVSSDEQKRIVAAITAALTIAAFDKPNTRFIVRKIRKI